MLTSNPCLTKIPNCKEQIHHNYYVFTKITFQRSPNSYENENPGLPDYTFSQLPQVTGILLSCVETKRRLSLPMCLQIIRSLQAQDSQETGHKDVPFPAGSCLSPPPKAPLSTQKRALPEQRGHGVFSTTHCWVLLVLSFAVLMQMKSRGGLRELLKQNRRHFFSQKVVSPTRAVVESSSLEAPINCVEMSVLQVKGGMGDSDRGWTWRSWGFFQL